MLLVNKEINDVTLQRMIKRCAEDMITDEQVARVLAPVLAMIQAGKFDQQKKRGNADEN